LTGLTKVDALDKSRVGMFAKTYLPGFGKSCLAFIDWYARQTASRVRLPLVCPEPDRRFVLSKRNEST